MRQNCVRILLVEPGWPLTRPRRPERASSAVGETQVGLRRAGVSNTFLAPIIADNHRMLYGDQMLNRGLLAGALLVAFAGPTMWAQTAPLADTALARQVDAIANQVLQSTGVPSASVAVVKNGRLAYANAYGTAKLDPRLAATPDMRYAIGSISKQFTAVAVLLLQQDGKLKLDDPVSRFIPGLTRGNEVTVRQLLSHTSGYQDFWPQDYVMPMMLKATTPQAIADVWAKQPLDFDPGSRWQYSNTNYTLSLIHI